MPKVTVVQVIYNHRKFIEPVFSAIFSQTYKDFNVVAVISGNDDGGRELLRQKFPQVEIIDPGYNIGFAVGHNLVFERYNSEFFQLVNPDLILEPDYIGNIIKVFDDPKVGAATGKLLRYDFDNNQKTNIIDTTGVTISKSGRARDRGQHEADKGQYDKDSKDSKDTRIRAVSGAGCMYRRAALLKTAVDKSIVSSRQSIVYRLTTDDLEFFDEDFHSYWEDVDLSWRMANAGWKNVFVPSAIGYHGRGAGSSENGYADVVGFIKHHKKLSPRVRELNYQNHIFMYIKNSPYFYPQFFVREFFMFFYVLFFEIGTLKVLPQMFKLLPKMWKKRKLIQSFVL